MANKREPMTSDAAISTASLHVERADVMASLGYRAEAKAYLIHLALGCFRYARALTADERTAVANRDVAARLVADGWQYANASRRMSGLPVTESAAEFPYCLQVTNPNYPNLNGHGCFVYVHEYRSSKPSKWLVEVQVLPPDERRSQCCANQLFQDRARAERYARRWVTIGNAVLAAQEAMNAESERRTA
jgi:hypothetical protein